MIINLYSVKDTLVGFSVPFGSMSDEVALRQFAATVRSPQPNFCNTFPENKELYVIAQFDDQSGKVIIDDSLPRFLARASSYVLPTETPVNLVSKGGKEENDV